MAVYTYPDIVSSTTDTFNTSSLTTYNTDTYGDCMIVSPETVHVPCDNDGNLLSWRLRLLVEDALYVGILPLLAVGGVLTNVINCVVFFHQGLKDRVSLCLFSLSLMDVLYLMLLYLRYLNKTLAYFRQVAWIKDVWVMSLLRYRVIALPAGFTLVSNLISTIIAVDRCVCVTWPLHAAQAVSAKVTATVIVVCGAMVFSGMQVVVFKYDVTCAVLAGGNISSVHLIIMPSALYKQHPAMMDILDNFVFSSLVPALSLCVISVTTTITYIVLRRATAWREGKVSLSKMQNRNSRGSNRSSFQDSTETKAKVSRTRKDNQTVTNKGNISREGKSSNTKHGSQIANAEAPTVGSPDATKPADSSSTVTQKEVNLTRMLVAISVVYIICVSPRVLHSLCRFLVPEFEVWGSLCNLVIVIEAVMNMLLALNSALNFFVFYWLGSRYRATLRRLVARKDRRLSNKAAGNTASVELADNVTDGMTTQNSVVPMA